jgi:hypothetical protein
MIEIYEHRTNGSAISTAAKRPKRFLEPITSLTTVHCVSCQRTRKEQMHIIGEKKERTNAYQWAQNLHFVNAMHTDSIQQDMSS